MRDWRGLAAAGTVSAMVMLSASQAETPQVAVHGWIADGEDGSFPFEFSRRLYHESLPAARAYAVEQSATAGQTADFAHGVTLFLGAVEGLVSDLSRHGLRRDDVLGLPFVRLWVPPPKGTPETMTYERFREMLQRFVDRLAEAEAVLVRIDDPGAVLPIRPAGPRLDLNGDGQYDTHERLLPILTQIVDPGRVPDDEYWQEIARVTDDFVRRLAEGDEAALAERDKIAPVFGYDRGDAAWLAGYAHLLSAMAEFLLAHDFEASFDHSFHVFFPDGDFPYPELKEIYRGRSFSPLLGDEAVFLAFGFDLAAFAVHSPWNVTDPEKMAAVRSHLKGMIAQSRRSWEFIGAETDNPAGGGAAPLHPEWIPAPGQAQTEGFPAVTPNVLRGWLEFLDAFEAMLDGRVLIPHWRFEKGLNLRRIFEEPRPLSPILMFQGSDALPYLEDGEIVDFEYVAPIMSLMGGDFFTYAVWFN